MDFLIGLAIMGIILGLVWYITNRNNKKLIKEISQQTDENILKSRQSTDRLINEFRKSPEKTIQTDERPDREDFE